jgi:hypothetical protein
MVELERAKRFDNAAEPTTPLRAGEIATSDEFDPSFRYIGGKHRIARRYIAGPDNAMEYDVLGLAGKGELSRTGDHQITVRQDVSDKHCGPAGEGLGLANFAPGIEATRAPKTHPGHLAVMSPQPTGREKELLDTSLDLGAGVAPFGLSGGGSGVFGYHNGKYVPNARGRTI